MKKLFGSGLGCVESSKNIDVLTVKVIKKGLTKKSALKTKERNIDKDIPGRVRDNIFFSVPSHRAS